MSKGLCKDIGPRSILQRHVTRKRKTKRIYATPLIESEIRYGFSENMIKSVKTERLIGKTLSTLSPFSHFPRYNNDV